jgi:signal transduction histidine kinase
LLAEETEEEMLIHVRDTGIGIADAELPHIFERFYRGHNGEHTAGSGLGLALVQQIMHLHGGAINVTSQPHQGSHFTVVLPRNRQVSTTIGIGSYSREDSDY